MQSLARSRHEIVNSRFKYWGILNHIYIDMVYLITVMPSSLLNVITYLTLNSGEIWFSMDIEIHLGTIL